MPSHISSEDIALLANEGRRLADSEVDYARSNVARPKDEGFLINIVPSRMTDAGLNPDDDIFPEMIRKYKFDQVLSGYLDPQWACSNFIYDYVTNTQGNELFPLHFDDFRGCSCLKIYIYLNECNHGNGALRFVPRTHTLMKELIANKSFMDFMAAQPDSNNSLTTVTKFLHEKGAVMGNGFFERHDETIDLINMVTDREDCSHDFCLEGPAGTVVIFDTVGIHGGGVFHGGERYICRFHGVDRRYQLLYAPEYLTGIKRIGGVAFKKLRKAVHLYD